MFGWFSPRCPLGTWEKAWAETRMRWLAGRLGIDRLRRAAVVLPTDEFFPDPYQGTDADARRMMDRLCGYMGVNPAALDFAVTPDEAMPGAAGRYEAADHGRAVVRVAESQLDSPDRLAATLAHELAHQILIGGGLLDPTAPDHEWVTDLVPVYLGVGVFGANAALNEAYHSDGNVSWWTIGKQGYLPARISGYALALFARARGEEDPPWAGHLRLDAATALRDGLRYIRKTGDCLFDPDARTPDRPPTAADVVDDLHEGSASARLAALWDVREHALTSPACLDAVVERLGDPDPAVAADAARTLAAFGPSAAVAVPRLREGLWAESAAVRAGASDALAELGSDATAAVSELCLLLADPDRSVLDAAARAVARLGVRADPRSVRRVLDRLEAALVDCDYPLVETLARAVVVTADDPRRAVREHFTSGDTDLRRSALRAIDLAGG